MQDNPTITYLSQPNLLRIDDLEIDVVIASTTCLLEEFGLSFKFQALDGLSLPGLSVELAIRDQEIKDSNVHIIGKHESLSLLGGTNLNSFSTHFAKQLRGRYNCLSTCLGKSHLTSEQSLRNSRVLIQPCPTGPFNTTCPTGPSS